MRADWLNLGGQEGDYGTAIDCLNDSPFDELVEIDWINDRCRNVYHVDGKYFVPILNGAWTGLYRYCADHMVHPSDRGAYLALMEPDTLSSRLEGGERPGVLMGEIRYRTVDGKWLWTRQVVVGGARNGLPDGICYIYIYDIDVQKQRELGRVATGASGAALRRDDLTGLLPDREFFALAQKKLPALTGQWCVVAVDVENYKLFCDWHGQQVGHFLLAGIGEILQRVERETGGLAGYRGQDDFALLAPYDMRRLSALFDELRRLIVSQGDSVGFQPIFGICLIEGSDGQIMDLYNHAALTAEQAKGDFRNRIHVYNPALQKKNSDEYKIIANFQRSLDEHEVFFCLQPQCRVSNGKVIGAESLARWRTRDGRIIPPTRFVPILEKYGMVTNLDKFIWEGVAAWLRGWIDGGNTPVPISVNVSQVDIFTVDVPGFFGALLEKYGLPARLIKIEITESAYAEDTAVVRETVRRLREQGFLVLMDDFGSGFSSLNMLRSLDVDVLKLDAQFLNISENESRKGIGILESIVNMANTMSLPVIVEGVETQEQINFLSDLGCRYMQGYYFYRPMPVEEFEDLIRDGRQVDLREMDFKANEQIHTREILNADVVNDAMLNNILGPVAIYRWDGGQRVDIVRYNQQFYRMMGLEPELLNARLKNVGRHIVAEDREKLAGLFNAARHDRLNGASGTVRLRKPNGVICWLETHLYYLGENDQDVRFYGSVKDVTEMQYVNADIPGGYHRCALNGEFLYISQGFLDMVGFTAEQIREQFGNNFANMVHRDDAGDLAARIAAIREGRPAPGKPYRIRKKDGYIYIVNQIRMTDLYGQLCFQSVAIDVDEVMKLRNQMRLLGRFLSDDVVFLRRKGEGWSFRVVVHGLERRLGLSAKAFEKALNSGELFDWIPSPGEAAALLARTDAAIRRKQPFEFDFTLCPPGGGPVRLHMKTDSVSDRNSKVEYICVFREE